MTTLVIGLIIFFAVHLLPAIGEVRERIVARLGMVAYKMVFALTALAGLVLAASGMAGRQFAPLWTPPAWTGYLAAALMFPACVLLAAAYLPNNIPRFIRHPMLWGVLLWAISHLAANGDFGSIVLFGSFAVYALFAMHSADTRGASTQSVSYSIGFDLGVAFLGAIAYGLLFHFHAALFGVSIL